MQDGVKTRPALNSGFTFDSATRLVLSGREEHRIQNQSRGKSSMARIIRHEKNSPYEVPEGTELPLYICACGLSKNKPFCDGSHKKTRDENPADTYIYDDTGRARVKTEY
jgi:CDGSH-type Zn-finger protein